MPRPSLKLGLVAGIALYALLRLLSATSASPTIFADSDEYARVASLSIFDPSFYAAYKPWVLPLLWKLVPGPVVNLEPNVVFGDIRPAVVAQTVVSIACWAALALVVAGTLRSRAAQAAAVVAVLGFSLSRGVTQWDPALLSESLSLTFAALVAATMVLLVRRPTGLRVAFVLGAVTLWTFTRDPNLLFVLFALPVLAIWLARRNRRLAVALVVGVLAVTAADLRGFDAGDRGDLPLRNVIALRMVRDGASPFFFEQGLPRKPGIALRIAERPIELYRKDPQLAEFRPWLDEHGRAAYVHYLVTHPGISLGRPLSHLGIVYSPREGELRGYVSDDQMHPLPAALETLVYPDSGAAFFVWAVLVLMAGAFFVRGRAWLVPSVLFAATLPTAILIWNGDGVELDRHLFAVGVLARVSVLTLGLAALDAALAYAASARRSSTVLPSRFSRRSNSPAHSEERSSAESIRAASARP